MTYETVVDEAIAYVPELRALDTYKYLDGEPPNPYVVFGALIIPVLEDALRTGDLKLILRICAFFEETSISSDWDDGLKELMIIEIGEWLGITSFEQEVSRWLGPETKRVCRYIPGLATQRLALREQKRKQRIGYRVSTWWKKLIGSKNHHAD